MDSKRPRSSFPSWLFLAAALFLPIAAAAADGSQPSGAERTYVVGGAKIHWKLDASRVPAASRERAVKMAETFASLGQPEAKDHREEVEDVEVLADGKRRLRVPAYLMNAAYLRFLGEGTELVCQGRPPAPAPAAAVSSSPEGGR